MPVVATIRQTFRFSTAVHTAILVGLSFLTSASHAADAPSACKYVKTDDIQLTKDRDHLWVDGSVNGAPMRMMLDTGATQSLIPLSAAESMSLPRFMTEHAMVGIGGIADQEVATISDLKVGSLTGRNVKLFVDVTSKFKSPFVLIAADTLLQHDFEVSVPEGVVRVFQPVDCEKSFLAYWDPNATVIDFHYVGSVDRRPHFDVMLNGHAVRAILDTGAQTSLIDSSAAIRAGITPNGAGSVKAGSLAGVGAQKTETTVETFDSFSIGSETIHNAKIRVGEMISHQYNTQDQSNYYANERTRDEMLIGGDFLRSHRVLFAVAQHKIYISYVGGPIFTTAAPPKNTPHGSAPSTNASGPKSDAAIVPEGAAGSVPPVPLSPSAN